VVALVEIVRHQEFGHKLLDNQEVLG
jgi:hypothetical protein